MRKNHDVAAINDRLQPTARLSVHRPPSRSLSMTKPPATPPSSDIEGADQDRSGPAAAGRAGVDPGRAEDKAREQSRGRPSDTKR